MRRPGWRQIAAIILTLLATASSLAFIVPESGITPSVTSQVQFEDATTTSPSERSTLTALQQITDPTKIGTQNAETLPGLLKSSPGNLVVEYIQTLDNFSSNLYKLNAGTQRLDNALSTGNFTHSTEDINQLKALNVVARSNLQSLTSILNNLENQGWNAGKVEAIKGRVDELGRLLDESTAQIDVLESRVNLRSPFLQITASKPEALINESLDLIVSLRNRNGTALPNRNVTVSWGPNVSTLLTNVNGSGLVPITLQVGFPAGNSTITAAFQPTGADASNYVSAYASTQLFVSYFPSRINAVLSSSQIEPLDYANTKGDLSTATGAPLANRTITLFFDNSILSRTITDGSGGFQFVFQIPADVQDGQHNVLIFFTPHNDKFAPSNITLGMIVRREQTSIRITTQDSIALSGLSSNIVGAVTNAVSNQGSSGGTMTLLLDGAQYATNPIPQDGSFSFHLSLPIAMSFGNHNITLLYYSDSPRVDGSTATINLYVVNSELVFTIAFACTVGSGALVLDRRRRRMRLREGERIVAAGVGVVSAEEEYLYSGQLDWNRVERIVEAETEPKAKIAASYRLARVIINNTLRVRTRESETSREFYGRVSQSKPALKSLLEPLIGLFETSEYSQYKIEASQSEQAKQILFSLHETRWT